MAEDEFRIDARSSLVQLLQSPEIGMTEVDAIGWIDDAKELRRLLKLPNSAMILLGQGYCFDAYDLQAAKETRDAWKDYVEKLRDRRAHRVSAKRHAAHVEFGITATVAQQGAPELERIAYVLTAWPRPHMAHREEARLALEIIFPRLLGIEQHAEELLSGTKEKEAGEEGFFRAQIGPYMFYAYDLRAGEEAIDKFEQVVANTREISHPNTECYLTHGRVPRRDGAVGDLLGWWLTDCNTSAVCNVGGFGA